MTQEEMESHIKDLKERIEDARRSLGRGSKILLSMSTAIQTVLMLEDRLNKRQEAERRYERFVRTHKEDREVYKMNQTKEEIYEELANTKKDKDDNKA